MGNQPCQRNADPDGVVLRCICCFNKHDGWIDPAALRRFDLKVKFDFLRPEQAWELLCRHCEKLNLPEPQSDLQLRIKRLQQLAPGDFSAVLRQHRFNPIQTPAMLVSKLEAECTIKGSENASIGFI